MLTNKGNLVHISDAGFLHVFFESCHSNDVLGVSVSTKKVLGEEIKYAVQLHEILKVSEWEPYICDVNST